MRGLAAGCSGPLSLQDEAPTGTGLREPVGRTGFSFTDPLPSHELLPPQVELAGGGDSPAALPRDRDAPHGADSEECEGSWVPWWGGRGVCTTGIANVGGKQEQAFSQAWVPGGWRCLRKEPEFLVRGGTPMGAPGLRKGTQSYL